MTSALMSTSLKPWAGAETSCLQSYQQRWIWTWSLQPTAMPDTEADYGTFAVQQWGHCGSSIGAGVP